MNKGLIALLIAFISIAGYYTLHSIPFTIENELYNETEESDAKQRWIENMLMDPITGKIPIGYHLKELNFLRNFQQESNRYNFKKTRSATWNARGPWNVGGRTRTIAVDVLDSKHVIIGSVSGGIWQTTDAGASWQKVSLPQAHPGCVSITQDTRPGKTNLWYALSGELYGTSASGGGAFYLGDGAFKSLDNGKTWTPIISTAGGTPNSFSSSYQGGWRIISSPVDTVNTCIYMATYGTIFRSTDTGNTWKAVLGSGNDSYFTDVAVTSSGVVYASISTDGTTKGFYRSGNGVNFTNITPSFLKEADRTIIEINPNNENEVYFLSELPSDSSGGVKTTNYEGTPEYVALVKYSYISGDGSGAGGNWTNLSANLPVNSPNQFDKFNCQGGYDLVLRVQPGTNNIVLGGTNLYISTDGFTTPSNTKQIGGYALATTLPNFGVYPNHHPDQHDLIFLKNNSKAAYSVSDGGIKYTNDINAESVQWNDISIGYITSQFYTISIDESKPYDQYLLGGLQDNGNYLTQSNDIKSTWQMTINGDGAYNYIAPNRSFYVISTQQGNVRKVILDERGNVLKKRRINPEGYDKSIYNFINNLVVDPNDNNFLFMPIGKRLGRLNNLKSIECNDDNSKLKSGWTISIDTINTGKLSNGAEAEITTVAISKKPSHVVYFGTSNRDLYRVDNATTGEPVFKKLSISRLPTGGYVSSIAIDPDSVNNVLICYSNYNLNSLFFTRDGGTSWYLVGGNLEGTDNLTSGNPSIRCVNILVGKNGKRTYFAGTSIGLFSTDTLVLGTAGSTNKSVWTQESIDKIGANVVTDIKVRNSDGYVVVATHGNGVFESYYTGNTPPPPFLQDANVSIYPNPSRNEINYTFTTSITDQLRADIFDLQGRRITTLLNSTYNPGTYTIKSSTSSLANGHYLISLYSNASKKATVNHFVVTH